MGKKKKLSKTSMDRFNEDRAVEFIKAGESLAHNKGFLRGLQAAAKMQWELQKKYYDTTNDKENNKTEN